MGSFWSARKGIGRRLEGGVFGHSTSWPDITPASSSRNGRGRIGVAVPGGFRCFSGGAAPVSILIDTLPSVAVTAKQLQVLQAAAATLGVWNYVVNFQILI